MIAPKVREPAPAEHGSCGRATAAGILGPRRPARRAAVRATRPGTVAVHADYRSAGLGRPTSGYNYGLPFAPRRHLARLIDVSPAHGSLLVFSRRFGPLRFPSNPSARYAQANRRQHRRGARPVPALRQCGRAAVGRRQRAHRCADALRRAVPAGGREGHDRDLRRAAALRHGLAVGEQGDRHRAALRPHAGAPHRARRRIHGHAEVGPARRQEGAVGRRARGRRGRAA